MGIFNEKIYAWESDCEKNKIVTMSTYSPNAYYDPMCDRFHFYARVNKAEEEREEVE